MFIIQNKEISPVKNDLDKKIQNTISSIFENRVPIFFPISKITKSKVYKEFRRRHGSYVVHSQFGKIEIRGHLLTQLHKTYLECMLSYPKQMLSDGSFFVEFTAYDLLKNKMLKNNPTDYETFKESLKSIRDCNLVIYTKDHNGHQIEINLGFIDTYIIDNHTHKYKVKFSNTMRVLWEYEHLILYSELYNSIVLINDYVIQNIVRYLITFDSLQISLKKLCHTLNFHQYFSKGSLSKKINFIRNSFEDPKYKDIYQQFGISYDSEFDNIIIKRPKSLKYMFKDNTFSQKLVKNSKIV